MMFVPPQYLHGGGGGRRGRRGDGRRGRRGGGVGKGESQSAGLISVVIHLVNQEAGLPSCHTSSSLPEMIVSRPPNMD